MMLIAFHVLNSISQMTRAGFLPTPIEKLLIRTIVAVRCAAHPTIVAQKLQVSVNVVNDFLADLSQRNCLINNASLA